MGGSLLDAIKWYALVCEDGGELLEHFLFIAWAVGCMNVLVGEVASLKVTMPSSNVWLVGLRPEVENGREMSKCYGAARVVVLLVVVGEALDALARDVPLTSKGRSDVVATFVSPMIEPVKDGCLEAMFDRFGNKKCTMTVKGEDDGGENGGVEIGDGCKCMWFEDEVLFLISLD